MTLIDLVDATTGVTVCSVKSDAYLPAGSKIRNNESSKLYSVLYHEYRACPGRGGGYLVDFCYVTEVVNGTKPPTLGEMESGK